MNITMDEATDARRLRGTVHNSRNLFLVILLASFSASSKTYISV